VVVYCGDDGIEFCGVFDMSADRWTKCPQCENNRKETLVEIERSYGNESADLYRKMIDRLNELKQGSDDTLKEDYEQGIDNGVYSVNYSAHCKKCGFKFDYKHEEEIGNG
jgi:transcription elongation factor Elf1